MAKVWALEVAVLMLGLLVMAQLSMQVSLKSPYVERSNCKDLLSKIGIVFPSDTDEVSLLSSGLFTPDSSKPYVDISGRRFHIGRLNGQSVVYVKTGYYSVNAAAAVQTLIQHFKIRLIIHFGNAGSLNGTLLPPGYVSAPEFTSFTGAWEWKRFGSNGGRLVFGDFNYPDNGENLLANVNFDTVPLYYSPTNVTKDFYLPTDSSLLNITQTALKDLELAQCYNGVCLTYKPEVVFGLKASTSDFYIKNRAYGEFLYQTFDVSTSDQESAAVTHVSLSNNVPVIIFRGVSNAIDVKTSSNRQLSHLASSNAFLAAATLAGALPSPRLDCDQ